MNKSDKTLIILLITLSLVGLLITKFSSKKGEKKAVVYRKNEVVLEFPLKKEETFYQVEGKNGKVEIISKNYGVMVEKEESKKHLCSKQGYIYETYETIVCLPNEIVVAIESETKLDAVVK